MAKDLIPCQTTEINCDFPHCAHPHQHKVENTIKTTAPYERGVPRRSYSASSPKPHASTSAREHPYGKGISQQDRNTSTKPGRRPTIVSATIYRKEVRA